MSHKKPERLTILYEDTTLKAFTDGVAVCSHAGIISDEAIIFSEGMPVTSSVYSTKVGKKENMYRKELTEHLHLLSPVSHFH